MNDAFCAHMLPVKRCPLFACSGHFRVIVTHSDTLKEMDCSGPGGPRGDHPLRHSRAHYLSALQRRLSSVAVKVALEASAVFCCRDFFFHFRRIKPWLGEKLFRSPPFKIASVWCYCRIWWRTVLLQADGQIGATVPPAVCFKKLGRSLLEVPRRKFL